MKKTGLDTRCLHNFSVDFNSSDVDDILNRHKYLMTKDDIKYGIDLLSIRLLCYCIVDH